MGILEEWEKSIVAKNTKRLYERSLRYFSEYMKADPETLLKLRKKQYGKKKFFEAKTIEFYKWLQDVKGLSPNSARSTIIGIQSFFSYFDVPLKLKRKLPKLHMKLDEEKVTIEHLRQIYKYNDVTVKTWISLSRDCPARIGDLLEIQRDQIKPEFLMNSEKESIVGKVFLSSETIDLFHKLWNIIPESEYAFSTPSGKKYDQTSINKMLRRSSEKAGLEDLKIHQHSFRKLWITTAINLGLQTEVIKILTFKSVEQSFLTYFLDREELREQWNRVVNVLSLEPKANGRVDNLQIALDLVFKVLRGLCEKELAREGKVVLRKRRRSLTDKELLEIYLEALEGE